MRIRATICCFILACAVLGARGGSAARARTWYVKADGAGDAPTIQAAIDSAASGDEILVGPGYYSWSNQGSGDEKGLIRFMRGKDYMTLRSESGPEQTVLDAEYMSRVIYCQGMNNATIDGFTIKRGEAPDWGDRLGGGFFTHIARERVRNCIFTANHAEYGGAVSCVVNDGFIRVEQCTFIGNEATRGGGALLFANGTGTCSLTDCTITGNHAVVKGGGVYQYNCNAVVERCVFSANTTDGDGSGYHAVGAYSARLSACTFSRNTEAASVLFFQGISHFSLERLIVAFNGGAALGIDGTSGGTIGCCDLYGNASGDAIPPGFADTGSNISVDPLFCGLGGSENYYLRSDSPCISENQDFDIYCDPMGARPVACGAVSVERTTWGAIKGFYR